MAVDAPDFTGSVAILGTANVAITGTPTVTISGTTTVALAAGSTVSITGTVTITGAVTISNTPAVTISGTPTVTISGTPTVAFAAGSTVTISGSVTVTGTVNIGNTPAVTISGGVTISNITAGTVSISGNVSVQNVVGGQLQTAQNQKVLGTDVGGAGGAVNRYLLPAGTHSVLASITQPAASPNTVTFSGSVDAAGTKTIPYTGTLPAYVSRVYSIPVDSVTFPYLQVQSTAVMETKLTAVLDTEAVYVVNLPEQPVYVRSGTARATWQASTHPGVGSVATVTVAGSPEGYLVLDTFSAECFQNGATAGAATFIISDATTTYVQLVFACTGTANTTDKLGMSNLGTHPTNINEALTAGFNVAGSATIAEYINLTGHLERY